MKQDPELEQEWLRQNSLGYVALIAIGVVMGADIECGTWVAVQAQGEQSAEQDHLAAGGQIGQDQDLGSRVNGAHHGPIKRAAAVYRLDLITRASTTACHCRAGAPGHREGAP